MLFLQPFPSQWTGKNGRIISGRRKQPNRQQDVYEPVPLQISTQTLRSRYKDAEMHTECGPYSEEEFCDFVRSKEEALVESVLCAGQFLKQLEDSQQKDTLKGMVADYIVDELVINHVARKHPDEASRRAYAYYRELYHQFMNKTLKNG